MGRRVVTKALGLVAYLLVTTLLVTGTLEVLARVLRTAPPVPPAYSQNVADTFLPWKPASNSVVSGSTPEFAFTYKHNGEGFRDVDHARDKPAGTFRILAVGDSFTYGVGASFEETFLYRLEESLNSARGKRVEILKYGIYRYWPEPERLVLEHYGLKYSPDLVLVTFLANDVRDTVNGARGLKISYGYLVGNALDRVGPAGPWLYLHSHLFRTLASPWVQESVRRATLPLSAASVDEAWDRIEREYDAMLRLTRGAGARLVVVYLPEGMTEAFPDRLARWAERNAVPFVNTQPALAVAAAQGTRLYWPQDGHCTPAGYAVVAKAVEEQLIAGGLLP